MDEEIARAARNAGMHTLREDGLAKVLLGETTLEEEHELQTFFKETPASDQLKSAAQQTKARSQSSDTGGSHQVNRPEDPNAPRFR